MSNHRTNTRSWKVDQRSTAGPDEPQRQRESVSIKGQTVIKFTSSEKLRTNEVDLSEIKFLELGLNSKVPNTPTKQVLRFEWP